MRYGIDMNVMEKEVWLTEGIAVLGKDGFSRITINNLCQRLQITKGSFYHHFRSIDGYISSLMRHWLEKNTSSIISQTKQAESAIKEKRLLYQLTLDINHKAEQNIRAWSYSHPIVKEYVEKADHLRLNFLTEIRIKMGQGLEKARDLAVQEYAVLIGIQQLFPEMPYEDMMRLQQLYLEGER